MQIIKLENTPNRIFSIDLYNSESGIKIFYTSIGSEELRINLAKKIILIGDVQQRKTNVKAAMTDWNSHSDPDFAELVSLVDETVISISDEYFFRPDIVWAVRSCWGAVYKKGDYTQLHDHYPATWSAVYYVEQPEDGSCLSFSGAKLSLLPQTGNLIIFPGNIEHEVPESTSNHDRVVVAMNFYVDRVTNRAAEN